MKKVVIITGASSGIGKNIAEYLQLQGFLVFGTSRNPNNYPDSKIPLVALDVRDEKSIALAFSEILKKTQRIDVVINNAGVGITGPLEETPIAEIKNNFTTNLFGPIAVIQTVLPQMRKQQSGLIINITSIAGYMGLPFRSAYSASKGALEIITESLRMEVKPFNIKVTNVAPGDFATNIASNRYHSPLIETSPYKETYGHSLQLMNEHVTTGSNPEQMAIAIHKIINSKQPKIHYKVGSFLQKFSTTLKNIIPELLYEKLLMKHYKLK